MTTTVTLGLITLDTFEIPAAIAFGGKQRLVVHDMPGGGRIIDVLGSTDSDITFSGIISGSDAESRAKLVDAMRVAGAALPLSWGEEYYLVIIAEAEFDYRKPWWIPYRLRCTVQSNFASIAVSTAVSAAVGIASDLSSAASLLTTMPGALIAAQTALSQPNATTYGTAAYGQSVSALTAAQSTVASDVATTGSGFPNLDLGFTGQNPVAAATAMTGTTAAAGSLAALTTAQGYLGSGLSALQNIGT